MEMLPDKIPGYIRITSEFPLVSNREEGGFRDGLGSKAFMRDGVVLPPWQQLSAKS
jgi:hypothetical protein